MTLFIQQLRSLQTGQSRTNTFNLTDFLEKGFEKRLAKNFFQTVNQATKQQFSQFLLAHLEQFPARGGRK